MTTPEDESGTIIQEPRSLDVLLKCKSYQGMTDEEITMLIEYREQMAALSAENEKKAEAVREQTEAMCSYWQQRADAARADYKAALAAAGVVVES